LNPFPGAVPFRWFAQDLTTMIFPPNFTKTSEVRQLGKHTYASLTEKGLEKGFCDWYEVAAIPFHGLSEIYFFSTNSLTPYNNNIAMIPF
jgi:hypothetical protein